MGDQASQGVLLTRSVDYMSVICHHDGHLLHHLDSSCSQQQGGGRRRRTRRRERRKSGERKRRGVQLTGLDFSLRVEEATGCFQESLRSRAPPTERRRGGESERVVQHTCLFLPLSLCNTRSVQQRRMSLLFFPFH